MSIPEDYKRTEAAAKDGARLFLMPDLLFYSQQRKYNRDQEKYYQAQVQQAHALTECPFAAGRIKTVDGGYPDASWLLDGIAGVLHA